jgi:hypothetical protein
VTATVKIPERNMHATGEALLREVGALVDEATEKGATFTERQCVLEYATVCTVDGGDPDASGRLVTALTSIARGANEADVVVPMLRRLDR